MTEFLRQISIGAILFVMAFIFFLLPHSCEGKEINVLIVDTGVDLSHLEIKKHVKDSPGYNYEDSMYHGTHIAGLILKDVCNQVIMQSCRYVEKRIPDYKESEAIKDSVKCFQLALKKHFDLINYSSGGIEPSIEEYVVLKEISDLGTKIVVAAGNNGMDLSQKGNDYFPAKYHIVNLIPIGNLLKDGRRNITSNYGLYNMKWMQGTEIYSTFPNNLFGYMSGTSQAAANYSNMLLKQMCENLK